jgi:hypothetical protein
VHLHLRAGFAVDPWLGLGIGYEWLRLSGEGLGYQNPPSSIEFSGWDYLIIEAGGEFRLATSFALGPFVGFSFGEYSSTSEDGYSRDLLEQALHAWLQLGLRGTINL